MLHKNLYRYLIKQFIISLIQESGIHEYKSQKEPFIQINNILQALKVNPYITGCLLGVVP